MRLVISLDVEEEGLFCGRYASGPATAANVAGLSRLEFIPREFGYPLTLLVSYQAVRDPAAAMVLRTWREVWGAEIGAHLHHWNTPPVASGTGPTSPLAARVPLEGLRAKLETLLETIEGQIGCRPRSFRMGRFDWRADLLALLPALGCTTDSSMLPLAHYPGQQEHFLTPPDPFLVRLAGSAGAGVSLVEVPLTMVEVVPGLAVAWQRLADRCRPALRQRLLASFRRWGAAGVHPTWFPLASMRWAVRWHRRRGGRVLTMFLHSSELHPGATPFFRTEAEVNALVRKIRAFLTWLGRTGEVQGTGLSQAAVGLDLPLYELVA